MTEQRAHCIVRIPSCGCEIVEVLDGEESYLRIRGCEEHPDAQGSEKGNAWAIVNYIKQLEANNETWLEYATHKPGCHENVEECICELDALLTSLEKPIKARTMPYAPH